PLVGDVLGTQLLGLTGDNKLVANVSGLEPGDYSVVVRKADSALGSLLNANGDRLTLAELGEGGVVLGEDNQALLLNTLETALNQAGADAGLGTLLTGLLGDVLQVTTHLGLGDLIEVVSEALNNVGLSSA